MSDKKKEETQVQSQEKPYDPNELVEYTAPLLPGPEQKDIYGAVNGETFRVKRGVTVKIKRKFLDVLMNAQAQQFAAYQTMAELHKKSKTPAIEM